MRDSFELKFCFAFILFILQVIAENQNENSFSSIIKKTLITTAHGCMNQVNATDSDLEYLRKDPPFPEKSACVVKCLLERIGIIKSNKYSKTGFTTAVAPLVFRNKKKMQHMKAVADNCDKEVNHNHVSSCQLGNEVVVCIYKYAPELKFKD